MARKTDAVGGDSSLIDRLGAERGKASRCGQVIEIQTRRKQVKTNVVCG
jgi:hypothetical protein